MMAAARNSIRRTLLARMLVPLLLITVLGGASAYGLARHVSQVVLDQWLYDTAISLASSVDWQDGRTVVNLPEGAREILEWDAVDAVYYEVVSELGERLIGNVTLPAVPDRLRAAFPVYYDAEVAAAPVRVLAIAVKVPHENPVIVKVAETQRKHGALAFQVLQISVVLSLLMAAACAVVIWYAIGSGVASMETAVREVRGRHAAAPLRPLKVDRGFPEEVLPLVHEINDLIGDLSAAHRVNQRFIADAAHQLRTPIATLRVQLDFAVREEDPRRRSQALADAADYLKRMGRMLHQLLTLAQADESEGGGVLAQGVVDIDRVAREELEHRIDDALARGVDLGYAGEGRRVPLRGAEDLLREAVANLVDNALRYGAAGGQVTVGVVADPPEVYVEDSGPGIPSDERAKVGARFYRIPGTGGQGCGLGLAIVSEIVRRHGGELALEDAAGGTGLRARLVFPRDPLNRA